MNICINCLTKTKNSKFCSNKCQQNYNKSIILLNWKEGKISGLKEGNRLIRVIREFLLEKSNYKCIKCGWGEKNVTSNTIPLEVNHIDGNVLNNDETNLEILCPNCHSLTPTWKALNKGKGNRTRLRYSKLV